MWKCVSFPILEIKFQLFIDSPVAMLRKWVVYLGICMRKSTFWLSCLPVFVCVHPCVHLCACIACVPVRARLCMRCRHHCTQHCPHGPSLLPRRHQALRIYVCTLLVATVPFVILLPESSLAILSRRALTLHPILRRDALHVRILNYTSSQSSSSSS